MIKKRNPTQMVKDLENGDIQLKVEDDRNYQEQIIEEVEVEEKVLDFGLDTDKHTQFERHRSNIYENMHIRPLDLAEIRQIKLRANGIKRIPRTLKETHMLATINFQYLNSLMKDEEIEIMPRRDR